LGWDDRIVSTRSVTDRATVLYIGAILSANVTIFGKTAGDLVVPSRKKARATTSSLRHGGDETARMPDAGDRNLAN
jgi:hypothetical protein